MRWMEEGALPTVLLACSQLIGDKSRTSTLGATIHDASYVPLQLRRPVVNSL